MLQKALYYANIKISDKNIKNYKNIFVVYIWKKFVVSPIVINKIWDIKASSKFGNISLFIQAVKRQKRKILSF